jgi:hypothetical protein
VHPSRTALPLIFVLVTAAACGGGAGTDAAPEATPPPDDLEQLDQLWADVATAQTELRIAETELIVECLATEGFTAHDIESMTQPWSFQGPVPSETLAHLDDPIGLPDAAEAQTYGLGYWLRFADTYGDQAGIELNEAASNADAASEAPDSAPVDLSPLEPAGEGWEQLPAVDQMRWEIAYRGAEWATTSKAASVLTAEDWAAVGLPGGEWTQADTLANSPQGCQGDVLTGLYGEPRLSPNAPTAPAWVWGPAIDLDAQAFAPITVGAVPEAEAFVACLADAGHPDWTLSESGGLDLYGHWQERYLPEAAQETSDGVTEYRSSDVTDADRDEYETAKAAEFAAAAAIAACDETSGYSAAAAVQYEQVLTQTFFESAPAQQDYLVNLEAALAAVSE